MNPTQLGVMPNPSSPIGRSFCKPLCRLRTNADRNSPLLSFAGLFDRGWIHIDTMGRVGAMCKVAAYATKDMHVGLLLLVGSDCFSFFVRMRSSSLLAYMGNLASFGGGGGATRHVLGRNIARFPYGGTDLHTCLGMWNQDVQFRVKTHGTLSTCLIRLPSCTPNYAGATRTLGAVGRKEHAKLRQKTGSRSTTDGRRP